MADKPDLTPLIAEIVASYVRNHVVAAGELPALIASVHRALAGVQLRQQVNPVPPTPAVPIGQSIQHEYLVCLNDGRRLTCLTRYLWCRYSLTPEAYRALWGLPADYPMVAPAYSELRSSIARRGRHRP